LLINQKYAIMQLLNLLSKHLDITQNSDLVFNISLENQDIPTSSVASNQLRFDSFFPREYLIYL